MPQAPSTRELSYCPRHRGTAHMRLVADMLRGRAPVNACVAAANSAMGAPLLIATAPLIAAAP